MRKIDPRLVLAIVAAGLVMALWLEPSAQPGACFCFLLPLPTEPIGDKTP